VQPASINSNQTSRSTQEYWLTHHRSVWPSLRHWGKSNRSWRRRRRRRRQTKMSRRFPTYVLHCGIAQDAFRCQRILFSAYQTSIMGCLAAALASSFHGVVQNNLPDVWSLRNSLVFSILFLFAYMKVETTLRSQTALTRQHY
jgi:hypothetical protein